MERERQQNDSLVNGTIRMCSPLASGRGPPAKSHRPTSQPIPPSNMPEYCGRGAGQRAGGARGRRGGSVLLAASRRREFCHFDGTPCLSLLKRPLKVQGGAIK